VPYRRTVKAIRYEFIRTPFQAERRVMSPRPKKTRNCQGRFCGKAFKPTGTPLTELITIELHRDELEALRLCDGEGMTQEEAGQSMGVSRGTIQRIITVARKKTATALTAGHALIFVDEEQKE
jgi:predicted DNA-binding protein (UPF0251 family)